MPFALRRVVVGVASAVLVATAAGAPASPAEPESTAPAAWSFSGFGTLGVVDRTSGPAWGLVRSRNQTGAGSAVSTTPDTRFGAQVNWDGGARWEAGAQAVIFHTPSDTPASEAIQWAYLGYRPLPNTRLRIGRASPDIFLYADSRHLGFALPWIRPPVDFYGFVPLTSVDGMDVEQRWYSADAVWRARATVGSNDSAVTDTTGARVPLHGRQTATFVLAREEGGLQLKLSYLHSHMRTDAGSREATLQQGLAQVSALPVPGVAASIGNINQYLWTHGPVSYVGLGAQYDTGPWTFIGEGSQLWVPGSPLNARRGYLSAGWRHGDVTYYGIASRVKPARAVQATPDLSTPLAPVVGAQAAQQAQGLAGIALMAANNIRYDQSTVSAGLRWDFRPTIALKLQFDRFKVRRDGGAGWRYYDGNAGTGSLLSVALDFVVGQ